MHRCIKRVVFFGVLFFFSITLNAQKLFHDTLFLKREIHRSDSNSIYSHNTINYSGVFVEKQKPSYYKYAMDYNFTKITVLGNYNPTGSIDIHAMREIPRRWYRVSMYNGKYYIVDEDELNKVLLTDTVYIGNSMEGAYSEGLNYFKKINRNTYQLNANIWHKKTVTIIIHIIDTAKGLAVFEHFTSGNEKHEYRLMVGGDKIKSFPLAIRFSHTKYLPDDRWYDEEPQIFMTDEFNAKLFLNKEYANKLLPKMP